MMHRSAFSRFVPVFLLAACATLHAAAVINASPLTGDAPLPVSFDASASSEDSVSFLWEFGDGTGSTAKVITHIFQAAGTYTVTLTVTSASDAVSTSQIVITVTGSGQGPVTDDMNFRWATTGSAFKLKHNTPDKDTFSLNAVFNTVDLPQQLRGLAASFSINGLFTVNGILGENGGFESPENSKPFTFIVVNTTEQLLTVFISKANLKPAFAAAGAGNITTPAGGLQVPITLTLTIGAQTYTLTENYKYNSTTGGSARGEYNLKKRIGTIRDGFFVVSRASALENEKGTGHFFEFEAYLSRPLLQLVQAPGNTPTPGSFRIFYNTRDREVLLFDSIKTQTNSSNSSTKINYDQSDRDLNGTRRLSIDVQTRRLTIRTWDLLAKTQFGGTGLPLREDPFTGFNFTIRMELDQPDGSIFQVVTATRLTRKVQNDVFWQTGRRNRRQ